MPAPLFKHHFCRRNGTGPKAYAHAAYLSGTKLDDGFGNTADFTPKGGILHAELWVPHNAPSWTKDRGKLWRGLELRESKTTRPENAILAHKFIGALPHELSLEENIRYVKDYVREQFTRKGYAADWAIHAPDPGSDSRNLHVHIMVPLRRIENGDWARTKDRFPKNSPALSQFIREKQQAFFGLQNRYLSKNGIEASIVRQGGKWTVVTSALPSRPATAKQASLHTTSSATNLRPYGLPSLQPPALGGAAVGTASRPQSGTAQSHGTAAGRYALLGARTKGWPEAAIIDWETWGHKNAQRFFALWPELSGPGFSPSGI